MIRRFSFSLRCGARLGRSDFLWKVMQHGDAGPLLDLGGAGLLPAILASRKKPMTIPYVRPDRLRSLRERLSEAILVVGDAIQMPFAGESIGCVFCNSVIKRVDQPAELARGTVRIGHSHFVQSANRGFPLEMHSLIPIPLYHVFPTAIQRLLCRVFRASYDYISGVRYLSESDLRRMFPDATLHRETVLGLTKSFYLYRTAKDEKRNLPSVRIGARLRHSA